MSVTISDPTLLSQLKTGDKVELKDPSGNLLGVFIPQGLGVPPGVKSPFTEEEMAARRKEAKTGRPLANILRNLELNYQVTPDVVVG